MTVLPARRAIAPIPPRVAAVTSVSPAGAVIIGHRGCGATAVDGHGQVRPLQAGEPRQNTRASFAAAHARGAAWVELDLLPSADGDLVVHHDTHLNAYGDDRAVWEVSTADLLAYGIEPLDGLCEALPAGLGLYLDLKASPGDVAPTYGPSTVALASQWIREHQSHRPLLAAAFNPFAVADLSAAGLRAGWIVSPTLDLHTAVVSAARAHVGVLIVHGTAFTAPQHELARAMDIARINDLTVWVWGPVLADLPRLGQLGVGGFCVDDISTACTMLA